MFTPNSCNDKRTTALTVSVSVTQFHPSSPPTAKTTPLSGRRVFWTLGIITACFQCNLQLGWPRAGQSKATTLQGLKAPSNLGHSQAAPHTQSCSCPRGGKKTGQNKTLQQQLLPERLLSALTISGFFPASALLCIPKNRSGFAHAAGTRLKFPSCSWNIVLGTDDPRGSRPTRDIL